MAEGGQLPWKVKKIDESRGPPADYSCLKSPLPKPPDGVEWRKDENTREWSLVRADDVEGENKRRYRLEVGTETEKQAVEGIDYLIHRVLPTDTLPGLCLRYRLKPTALRQINRFSGSNLRLAPSTLIIPLEPDGNGLNGGSVRAQDRTTPEFKLHA